MSCRCGGAGSSEHEHAVEEEESRAKSLLPYIDIARSSTLNVREPVRLDRLLQRQPSGATAYAIESDVDEQIIIKIQFSATVRVRAIGLESVEEEAPSRGDGPAASSPRAMRAFVNMPSLDFASVEASAGKEAQAWEGLVEGGALIMYPTRVFKFSSVNHLTLYLPSNHGGQPRTRLSFVGLYGDFGQTRVGVVNAVYETKPMVADHKVGNASWMAPSDGGSF